jgi:hypothetical protein
MLKERYREFFTSSKITSSNLVVFKYGVKTPRPVVSPESARL